MSDDQGPAPRPHGRRAALRDSKILGVNVDGLVLLLCVVLFVALASFGMSDSTYARVERGPLLRLSGEVVGSAVAPGGETGAGWFAMTTVQVRTLNWGEVILETVRARPISPLDDAAAPRVAAQMDASKHLAAAVALDVAGYTYESQPGAYIGAVTPGSPAASAGVLPGSVVLAVDGVPVATPQDVADRITVASASGVAAVTLTVLEHPLQSDAATLEHVVEVIDGRIGVELLVASAAGLASVLDLPTGQIGGPSAGLMLTLTFLDAMHPGDLTAGLRIAGTGTISTSRSVGPVAGAPLKASAARDADMDVFFTPREHAAEVYDQSGDDMLVVPVATVADAIAALCALGATDELCVPSG